jgi:hypothetical protein
MKPTTAWIAIVLLAVGVCGLLDAAGVVAWSQTIEQWWPLAVAGWAVAEMLGERRVTLAGVVIVAVGLALLADAQDWASDATAWSVLAIFLGLVVLVRAFRPTSRSDKAEESRPATGWCDGWPCPPSWRSWWQACDPTTSVRDTNSTTGGAAS